MDYEIAAEEVKKAVEHGQSLTLLDVREPWEVRTARIAGAKLIPMKEIAQRAQRELDPREHIVVFCHHGVRSLKVAAWLRQQGFSSVQSMAGGIDQWSRSVDAGVPLY